MSRWKATERRVAAYLGGERVPVTGRTGERGMATPDIDHGMWSIEVKDYGGETVPKWLKKAMAQAKASLKPDHIAPVAIIHPKGAQIKDSLCVIPLEYLKQIQERLEF